MYNLCMAVEEFIGKTLKDAGDICMKGFGHIKCISHKGDQSNVVTEVDIASEKSIISHIKRQFPHDTIIAEETGFYEKDSSRCWIIDPIDGTSNFAAGIPWFGVMIARLENWVVTASGIFLPAMDELYFAEKGNGAYLNGHRIHVSPEDSLKNVLVAYGVDYSEIEGKTEREMSIVKKLVGACRNLRTTNSAVDDCYVAAGKFGASLNQTTMIWDDAAPSLIVEEAGGVYTDIEGKPLNFEVTKENYLKDYTSVAASKALHPKIMQLLKN